MNLQYRINLLERLGQYMLSDEPAWMEAKEHASRENGWFIPSFVDRAVNQIATRYLTRDALEAWFGDARTFPEPASPKNVGIVMAGNIPLVGFHDWLCVFLAGHLAVVKPSSRDRALIEHLAGCVDSWSESGQVTRFEEMLKGCDAYIATGSNQSSRYFDYYFSKYPHIIRRNRTSAALLTGKETPAELDGLADDVHLYFGLGCRNVTSIAVPRDYDFVPLLDTFRRYGWMIDHHKYKNNYDYNLALLLLNKQHYMTNGSLLLTESDSLFSPISQLHYAYYDDAGAKREELLQHGALQCLVSTEDIPFGEAQNPLPADYADGVNTLAFVTSL